MTTVGTKTYVMNIGSHEHNLICSANKQTKTFRMGNDSNRNVRPQHPIPYILEILKRKGAVTLYYRVRSRLASTQNQGAQGQEFSSHMTIYDNLTGTKSPASTTNTHIPSSSVPPNPPIVCLCSLKSVALCHLSQLASSLGGLECQLLVHSQFLGIKSQLVFLFS